MADTYYDSLYPGAQIDEGVGKALNADAAPTDSSDNLVKSGGVYTALAAKQDALVSGTSIKTVNSSSLLGSGDIAVQEVLVSGTNIKTINSTSLLGSGNIDIAGGGGGGIPFGVCSTAAGTAAKTVDITGITELTDGLTINVMFVNATSSPSTLNVNSLGAYDIRAYGSTQAGAGSWQVNEVVTLVFYSNKWYMVDAARATTGVYGYTILSDAVNNTSTTYAATANAVKTAYDLANGKQDALVSGTNIKTINSTSLLGSGNIDISGGGGSGLPFGVCSTAAATQEKTVDITGITELTDGLTILVLFTNAQTYSAAPKLNVNSLGAYTVYETTSDTSIQYAWKAGEIVPFTYYGSKWYIIDGGTASTTYFGVTKLSSSTSSTATDRAATSSAVKAAYDLANGKQDALVSGTNIKTIGGQSVLGSTDIPIALPLLTTANIKWNAGYRLGTLSSNVSMTLPTIPSDTTAEIRITAYQSSGGSRTITLTAPTGATITDGSTSGSSLTITPTATKYIEISVAVVGAAMISVLKNEV